jgi:hypothetical protein
VQGIDNPTPTYVRVLRLQQLPVDASSLDTYFSYIEVRALSMLLKLITNSPGLPHWGLNPHRTALLCLCDEHNMTTGNRLSAEACLFARISSLSKGDSRLVRSTNSLYTLIGPLSSGRLTHLRPMPVRAGGTVVQHILTRFFESGIYTFTYKPLSLQRSHLVVVGGLSFICVKNLNKLYDNLPPYHSRTMEWDYHKVCEQISTHIRWLRTSPRQPSSLSRRTFT